MPRTDDDSWDITESVGATALGVAAARAAETEAAHPLIEDPFARVFLDSVGTGMWSVFSGDAVPPEMTEIDPDLPARWQAMVDYMAARTAFFDRFFVGAADAGIRQVVILAAGLDSRAWRLPWPDGVTVYEIDQPKVLEFKSSTLRDHGAQPKAGHVSVAVDLRQNWPHALRKGGFDPSAPTTWSAEGLLPFLPARAQDLLFERIHELSAAGSRVAVEATSSDFFDPERLARQREQMRRYHEIAAKLHTIEVPDFQDLWYVEEHADVGDWLRAHGWRASAETAHDLMARYGRHVPESVEDTRPRSLFVTAER